MQINSSNNAQNPLTPSELNQTLAKLLKSELNSFWLNGEVSDYFRSQAGHSYFSLKDSDASIRCVLFKQQSNQTIEQGQQIIVFGYLSAPDVNTCESRTCRTYLKTSYSR